MPFKASTILYRDNIRANTAAYDPVLHAHTKHTLLKFHYVREKVKKDKLIEVIYLETSKMPADGLTKPLTPQMHRNFLRLIGLEALGGRNGSLGG
jgi:hypothetical protein